MSKLEKRIHDEKNGLDYVLVGDYYIPALIFPEGRRHIGKWGRMHRAYLKEHHPNRYNALLLSGKLGTYLADLDEQAQVRFETIVRQIDVKAVPCTERRISSSFCYCRISANMPLAASRAT